MNRTLGLVLVALFFAPRAHAQSSVAEELFREGKRLMDEKHFDLACPKLEESQRLDPGAGTLLTLALCHEALGKTATAWAEFHESQAIAARDHRDDRHRVASAHIAALDAKLSRLTVQLPWAVRSLRGLSVRVDGVDLREAAWGVAAPVDPGKHVIEVRADGKTPFSEERMVASDGANETVTVPELSDVPAAVEPPPPAPPAPKPAIIAPKREPKRAPAPVAPPSDDSWRTIGFVSAGVGVVGIGLGGYFGLRAISKAHDADKVCPDSNCSNQNGLDLERDAGRSADISTISFVVGGAALAFAGYALLIHPSGSTKARSGSIHPTPLGFRW